MSRIDVIVPCYNYGRFLRDSVDSILRQSHADVRVLILDDASTDETPNVAAELAAADRRVEYRRHAANIGHIGTYNEAIDLARGDYMLLLSADDFLLPGALGRAGAVFDADPAIGLVHGICLSYRAGDRLSEADESLPAPKIWESSALIERLAVSNCISTATAVVRTSAQKQIGRYRPDLPHTADLEMWLRFALHGKVAYIPAPQAAHRYHGANMALGYDRVADLLQCVEAFRCQIDAIRERLRDGSALEARMRRIFARRSLTSAIDVLWQGQQGTCLRLLRLWLQRDQALQLSARA
jgi:glycosyltransferase involved in cell wall biosynthesis